MPTFFNIHTHKQSHGPNTVSLLNVFPENFTEAAAGQCFSVGLHPWHVNRQTLRKQLELVAHSAQHPSVLAVGEIGLDRACSTAFAEQQTAFAEQVEIAEKYRLPIVVHSVKSYSDLLNLLKRSKPQTPWVFHGFNASAQTAQALLKFPNTYFSVGKNALRPSVKLQKCIAEIPINRIFAETDEAAISVKEIYARLAKLKEINVAQLALQIEQNFTEVFTRWTKITG